LLFRAPGNRNFAKINNIGPCGAEHVFVASPINIREGMQTERGVKKNM
jgi:hypothetical protein